MSEKEILQHQIFSIRVRYCGGCNPKIDRKNVVRRLQRLLESAEYKFQFVTTQNNAYLLLINGCLHACLDEQIIDSIEATKKGISIQGERFDYQSILEENLPYAIWEKIKVMFADYFLEEKCKGF